MTKAVSVVLPTRNPHPGRLGRTLESLARQTLAPGSWELLLVDNGSSPGRGPALMAMEGRPGARILAEATPGLTPARLAGIRAAAGAVVVFVDDDNVLAPGYLAAAAARFSADPGLGAAGGPVQPEWESPPPEWLAPFAGLLALRDLGPGIRIARGGADAPWPAFAPVGAGLCIRRTFAAAYARALETDPVRRSLDRSGTGLASGGDSDLVFTALHAGGSVAYYPELSLTHLIPPERTQARYLARLNAGIMRSWVRVLGLHGQCPWPPIPRWSVAPRAARAWLRLRPWESPAARVRWAGALGQFRGQADLAALEAAR